MIKGSITSKKHGSHCSFGLDSETLHQIFYSVCSVASILGRKRENAKKISFPLLAEMRRKTLSYHNLHASSFFSVNHMNNLLPNFYLHEQPHELSPPKFLPSSYHIAITSTIFLQIFNFASNCQQSHQQSPIFQIKSRTFL